MTIIEVNDLTCEACGESGRGFINSNGRTISKEFICQCDKERVLK